MKLKALAVAMAMVAGSTAAVANVDNDTSNPAWAGDTKHWSFFLYGQTPYPVEQGILESQLEVPEGFEQVHLNIMGRHGSRYATGRHESVDAWAYLFNEAAEGGKLTRKGKQYVEDTNEYIASWSEDKAGHTTALGFEELIALGERAANTFDKKELKVVGGDSGALRAKQTVEAFVDGVNNVTKTQYTYLGEEVNYLIDPQSPNNPEGRFYHDDVRPPMYRQRQPNFDYHTENPPQSAVTLAAEYAEGLDQNASGELVFSMYRLCQQDASQNYAANMCAPFEEHVQTEAGKDTYTWLRDMIRWEQFYFFGPAVMNEGSQQVLSKPLLEDIIATTDAAARGDADAADINSRFGHDAGMAGIYISLGLIQERGYDRDREQGWKDWGQVPMGGNMIWQLLRGKKDPSNLQVRMYVNEQLVSFPFAEGKDMVSWEEVKQHYTNYLATVPSNIEFRKSIGSYMHIDDIRVGQDEEDS